MDRNTRLIRIAVRLETALYALREAHLETEALVGAGEDHRDLVTHNQITQAIVHAAETHNQICDQINIARVARQEEV
jgi:hypothetical protein